LIEMGVLMALALHQRGDREAALDHLTHALALAKPEGYVQPFLDAGASLVPLLRKAAAQGYVPDFVDILLAAFPTQAAPVPDATAHRPPSAISPLIEPLTPRELEILALIAEGCTNRTIAERLVIALNTVKNHTRSIYGKLGVHNRTQAVARARELGVL